MELQDVLFGTKIRLRVDNSGLRLPLDASHTADGAIYYATVVGTDLGNVLVGTTQDDPRISIDFDRDNAPATIKEMLVQSGMTYGVWLGMKFTHFEIVELSSDSVAADATAELLPSSTPTQTIMPVDDPPAFDFQAYNRTLPGGRVLR